MRLLDTDILIDLQRGYPPALVWFASLTDPSLVPGYVAFEMIAGCDNARAVRRLQRWLGPFRICWPTTADADRALLTAECAVGLGVPLCTFNARHFRAVPNLVIQQPYGRI